MYTGRMLILDDDAQVGKVVKRVADASGLEARLLTDPQRFLSEVAKWNPTHIALDLVMPEMDGVQVLAELSILKCAAKIIITSGMSARVLDAAARAGHERGLNIIGVLSKPFSAGSLRALLSDAPARLSGDERARRADPGDPSGSFQPSVHELRRALEGGEFKVAYQPKVECATGRLAGFEALARWPHPDRGLVMPDQFISALEQHGLINALTETVLDQALAWFSRFLDSPSAASDSISLSVNFPVTTFADESFIFALAARCRKVALAPHRVVIELTETRTIKDSAISLDLATRLRMQGFQLSIDDFGKGYSSLLRLLRLPFSEIKIDHSFVSATMRSEEARTVVESIVQLGRSIGLTSVAEGVEDLQILEYLRRIGCDQAQGYAIARPMDGDAVRGWADQRTPGPASTDLTSGAGPSGAG